MHIYALTAYTYLEIIEHMQI